MCIPTAHLFIEFYFFFFFKEEKYKYTEKDVIIFYRWVFFLSKLWAKIKWFNIFFIDLNVDLILLSLKIHRFILDILRLCRSKNHLKTHQIQLIINHFRFFFRCQSEIFDNMLTNCTQLSRTHPLWRSPDVAFDWISI